MCLPQDAEPQTAGARTESWGGYTVETRPVIDFEATAQGARGDLTRWLGPADGRNLLLGGLGLHQERTPWLPGPEEDPCGSRFGPLGAECATLRFVEAAAAVGNDGGRLDRWMAAMQDPLASYGADPVFEASTSIYNPKLAGSEGRFYNTSNGSPEIGPGGGPLMWHPEVRCKGCRPSHAGCCACRW